MMYFFLGLISLSEKRKVLRLAFKFSVYSKTTCQETMEFFIATYFGLFIKKKFSIFYISETTFSTEILHYFHKFYQIVRNINIHIHKNINHMYRNIPCANLTENKTSFVNQIHRTLVK